MKKSKFTKLLAVILALSVVMASFGAVTAGASNAYPVISNKSDNAFVVIISDIVDTILRFITNMISGLFDEGPGFVPEGDAETAAKISANYYDGIGKNFQSAAQDGAKWHMGYANGSLIPNDYSNGTYYIGGYIAIENGFSNVVEGIAEIPGLGKDDMKVRAIAVNDGTGKGTVLFATIDCIGITNADIKDIRALLKDFAADNNIAAINISSTHTHSCIDTEGLWTKNLHKIMMNGINSNLNKVDKNKENQEDVKDRDLMQGTNPAYMAFLKDRVASVLKAAYNDLQPGTLTYAKKDVGQDYFQNKNRPSSGKLLDDKKGTTEVAMTDLNRFIFTPDDTSKKPTMMLNMAAHPDVAGLPTDTNSGREISGDFIFYCGKFLEDYDYNFMFWQGAIAGIYMSRSASNDGVELKQRVEQSQRYGYEIARMALSMTLTEDEILLDPVLSNKEEVALYATEEQKDIDPETNEVKKDAYGKTIYKNGYSVWYENWQPVTETPVDAFLNLYIKQVEIPIANGVIESAGKLNLANYVVIQKADGSYSTVVEIGYMEMGSQFKAVFLPGEVCQDLIAPNGKSLKAKFAATAKPFSAPTACSIFGDDIMCFGLMNDAIGYIVPDNDYTMGDPVNHYHELISLGQGVASALMNGLAGLSSEIVYA